MALPGLMNDVTVVVLLTENVNVENKEEQWMGVTVQSQGPGGKIVVSGTDLLSVSSPLFLPAPGLTSTSALAVPVRRAPTATRGACL